MRWLYFGGWSWLPVSRTSNLIVGGNRLFGHRGDQCIELLSTNIVDVKEYCTRNPFLRISTTDGDFHVGVKSEHYDEVVRVLRGSVGDDFCRTFAHRWNVLLYRKQFSIGSLLKAIVGKKNGRN